MDRKLDLFRRNYPVVYYVENSVDSDKFFYALSQDVYYTKLGPFIDLEQAEQKMRETKHCLYNQKILTVPSTQVSNTVLCDLVCTKGINL